MPLLGLDQMTVPGVEDRDAVGVDGVNKYKGLQRFFVQAKVCRTGACASASPLGRGRAMARPARTMERCSPRRRGYTWTQHVPETPRYAANLWPHTIRHR